jgi:hypothetical protein
MLRSTKEKFFISVGVFWIFAFAAGIGVVDSGFLPMFMEIGITGIIIWIFLLIMAVIWDW